MNQKSALGVILLTLIAFLAGGYRLLWLKYERGDVYQNYSSYLAAPKGTKALYESLNATPGMNIQRNITGWNRLKLPQEPSVFILQGVSTWLLAGYSGGVYNEWLDWVTQGNRLVLCAAPTTFTTKEEQVDQEESTLDEKTHETETKADPESETLEKTSTNQVEEATHEKSETVQDESVAQDVNVRVLEEFGIDINGAAFTNDQSWGEATFTDEATASLQQLGSVVWASTAYITFLESNTAWRVLATRDGYPVLLEKKWGKGTIVLATDTYFMTNESLFYHDQIPLITWLIGDYNNIIMDEVHLGTAQNPGIMYLIKKNNLEGFIWGALIVAVLYIWKSSTRQVPVGVGDLALQEPTRSNGSKGDALVHILSGHIPSKKIIPYALQLLQEDQRRLPPTLQKNLDWILQETKQTAKQTPSNVYNATLEKLQKRKSPWKTN